MKKLVMVLPLGDTTQSSIDVTRLAKSGSEISPGSFMRNSAGSSGKVSRSTARQPTTLWPLRPMLTNYCLCYEKYNKEVNLQVKWCNAMLDAATMTDPTLNPAARRRGQDPDHFQSPRGDSAKSVSTSGLEHDQSRGKEDFRDLLHTKDARERIKNHHQDRDRVKRE
jgi:hypothetical protein